MNENLWIVDECLNGYCIQNGARVGMIPETKYQNVQLQHKHASLRNLRGEMCM